MPAFASPPEAFPASPPAQRTPERGRGTPAIWEDAPIPRDGLDEPLGPPPEEYCYRCLVCGKEMLVNEAIIDGDPGASRAWTQAVTTAG
jgi:hypothetical protein